MKQEPIRNILSDVNKAFGVRGIPHEDRKKISLSTQAFAYLARAEGYSGRQIGEVLGKSTYEVYKLITNAKYKIKTKKDFADIIHDLS